MTPLIGAYLADSMWGRYKTILVFSSIYLVVSKCAKGTALKQGRVTPRCWATPLSCSFPNSVGSQARVGLL